MNPEIHRRPSPSFLLEPGQVLAGAYRILRPVGRGGMGEVYEASHARLSGRYAVKLLLEDINQNDDALRRFQQEAEVTSRLRHPNIVPVIDFDRMESGAMYMVMEFLEGQDLAAELNQRGSLPLSRVADIVDQIASGLAAAHAEHIVHRDLKPGNIFLSPLPGRNRELVRILDFGISKVRSGAENLTRTQALMGTPRYMSPEQARGLTRQIDVATDQFALSTIAYEMLTGQPAFLATELAAIVYQIVHEEPQSFTSLGLNSLLPVEPVLRRALAKAPQDRYASIDQFAQAFVAAAGTKSDSRLVPETGYPRGGTLPSLRSQPLSATTMGLSIGEAAPGPHIRPGHRRSLVVVGAAVGALSLGAFGLSRRGGDEPKVGVAPPALAPSLVAAPIVVPPDAAAPPLVIPVPAPVSPAPRRRSVPASNLVKDL